MTEAPTPDTNQPESDKSIYPEFGGIKNQQPDTELRKHFKQYFPYIGRPVDNTIVVDLNDLEAFVAAECQAARAEAAKVVLSQLRSWSEYNFGPDDITAAKFENHIKERLASLRSASRKDAE